MKESINLKTSFRIATTEYIPEIWAILQGAISRRKEEGSDQWQDGYPNPAVLQDDIEKNVGFVLTVNESIAGYFAILINDEPEYQNIDGSWLTDGDFIAVHRIAIAENYLGKGLAKLMFKYFEEYACNKNIFSIKADTNFDNPTMLHIFKKMSYQYCGEVAFRGKPRKAFEKVLSAKTLES